MNNRETWKFVIGFLLRTAELLPSDDPRYPHRYRYFAGRNVLYDYAVISEQKGIPETRLRSGIILISLADFCGFALLHELYMFDPFVVPE